MKRAALGLAAVAIAFPAAARANGDPASDVIPGNEIFVTFAVSPTADEAAVLRKVTDETKKGGLPIRAAVIYQVGDLGTVGSLWRQPQAYAKFLDSEITFAYKGTLVVSMPNGFGVAGPGATAAAKRALAKLPRPKGDAKALVLATATAVARVAGANGKAVSVPRLHSGGGLPTPAVAGIVAGGLLVVAAAGFLAVRRWLLSP
jgi:hypothetical protein